MSAALDLEVASPTQVRAGRIRPAVDLPAAECAVADLLDLIRG